MVERFLAMILALMAAIFSTDMASDRDLHTEKGDGPTAQVGNYRHQNFHIGHYEHNKNVNSGNLFFT